MSALNRRRFLTAAGLSMLAACDTPAGSRPVLPTDQRIREVEATRRGSGRVRDILDARLVNRLLVDNSIHWHGVALRNDMDGVPGVTQPPVRPGAELGYRFTVAATGTY